VETLILRFYGFPVEERYHAGEGELKIPTCTVAIRNSRGVPYWVTTAGDTLFEVCASAARFLR
jgi:hypothetical protein